MSDCEVEACRYYMPVWSGKSREVCCDHGIRNYQKCIVWSYHNREMKSAIYLGLSGREIKACRWALGQAWVEKNCADICPARHVCTDEFFCKDALKKWAEAEEEIV